MDAKILADNSRKNNNDNETNCEKTSYMAKRMKGM